MPVDMSIALLATEREQIGSFGRHNGFDSASNPVNDRL